MVILLFCCVVSFLFAYTLYIGVSSKYFSLYLKFFKFSIHFELRQKFTQLCKPFFRSCHLYGFTVKQPCFAANERLRAGILCKYAFQAVSCFTDFNAAALIPEHALENVNSNYRINVAEVAFPDDKLGNFHSDFRIIAEYFVNKRKNTDYVPSAQEIRHVGEFLKLLQALTGDRVENGGIAIGERCGREKMADEINQLHSILLKQNRIAMRSNRKEGCPCS